MSPGKKPLALRIDPVLLARVDRARGDVSRTRWVERALESALAAGESSGDDGPGQSLPSRPTPASSRASASAISVKTVIPAPYERIESGLLRCPVRGCNFRARSPMAKCPDHGRTVVPE